MKEASTIRPGRQIADLGGYPSGTLNLQATKRLWKSPFFNPPGSALRSAFPAIYNGSRIITNMHMGIANASNPDILLSRSIGFGGGLACYGRKPTRIFKKSFNGIRVTQSSPCVPKSTRRSFRNFEIL